jgi:hypothetical protein
LKLAQRIGGALRKRSGYSTEGFLEKKGYIADWEFACIKSG